MAVEMLLGLSPLPAEEIGPLNPQHPSSLFVKMTTQVELSTVPSRFTVTRNA